MFPGFRPQPNPTLRAHNNTNSCAQHQCGTISDSLHHGGPNGTITMYDKVCYTLCMSHSSIFRLRHKYLRHACYVGVGPIPQSSFCTQRTLSKLQPDFYGHPALIMCQTSCALSGSSSRFQPYYHNLSSSSSSVLHKLACCHLESTGSTLLGHGQKIACAHACMYVRVPVGYLLGKYLR